MRPIRLTPGFLFQINWADSGPGVSWPESYHLTLIFGYDRWVVTMSDDFPEAWGYTDLAIGWFGIHEGKREGVRRVIRDWWRGPGDGSEEVRWDSVWKEGEVSAEEADAWADEVWKSTRLGDDEPLSPGPGIEFDYDFRPRYWPPDAAVTLFLKGEHLPPYLPRDPLTLAQMLAVVDIIQFGADRRGGSFIWKVREVNLEAGADLESKWDSVTVRSPFSSPSGLLYADEFPRIHG